ncbi:MAG: glycosyltransferase [Phycisphaeraceae bacterium]|nr:MAG: glycosyltransferase [Phycisphaeraceae bacterium]
MRDHPPTPPPASPPAPSTDKAPLLIALPHGATVSGVTTWALRLARALPARGRRVVVALHAPKPGERPLPAPALAGVEVADLSSLPSLEHRGGDLAVFVRAYRDLVRSLRPTGGGPVVLSPNLLGDCYGIAASICALEPESVRVVGWQHLDSPYDAAVLARYEPVIARFVAVSPTLHDQLIAGLPRRAAEIERVPYGVEVPGSPAPRPPLGPRPARLIYTGRIDDDQKRVGALIAMSDELSRMGVDHRLTLLGGGPAEGEIDAACASRPRVRRLAELPPDHVARVLDEHDVFVLASRAEGLSLSLIEAMARGCVPVVARTRSGAAAAVDDGRTGVIVEAPTETDHAGVGRAMALGVRRALEIGIGAMSVAAHAGAGRRFGLWAHADAVDGVLSTASASGPRWWPASLPCAFTGSTPAGSGSVPSGAAERAMELLGSLAGRRVVIHGAGRHTIELASVLATSPAVIVAVTDDDPAKHGRMLLGWPILAPREAATTGATDVVISTWMNHGAVWARRGVYTGQGLRVHAMYPTP